MSLLLRRQEDMRTSTFRMLPGCLLLTDTMETILGMLDKRPPSSEDRRIMAALPLNNENWDDNINVSIRADSYNLAIAFGNAEGTHAHEHIRRKCGNEARRSGTMFSIFLNLSFFAT